MNIETMKKIESVLLTDGLKKIVYAKDGHFVDLEENVIPDEHIGRMPVSMPDGKFFYLSAYTCGSQITDKHSQCLIGRPAKDCDSYGATNCGKWCVNSITQLTSFCDLNNLIALVEQ